MGLNCGCPVASALPELTLPECGESIGQVQKVIFQRIFKSAGTRNTMVAATAKEKATWQGLFSASDGSKTLISPYINAPENEPGAARTYGGGNATVNGIEIIIGRDPSTFTCMLLQQPQSVIATLKKLMCENIGVYLIDEFGRIIGDSDTEGTNLLPIPIQKFFVGDKKLGGFENPDSNTMEWSFLPNWSDNMIIVTPTDFNALTDLTNGMAA